MLFDVVGAGHKKVEGPDSLNHPNFPYTTAADRQTNIHTDTLIAILRSPTGVETDKFEVHNHHLRLFQTVVHRNSKKAKTTDILRYNKKHKIKLQYSNVSIPLNDLIK